MIIEKIEEIIKYSFGLSIYTFFRNIKGYNENMNVEEQKKAFFQLLEYLLNGKIITFVAPGADVYRTQNHIPKFTILDKEAQWNISPESIIQYFRDRWPENIQDSDDAELVYFLFKMPEMIWIADDGGLLSSNS